MIFHDLLRCQFGIATAVLVVVKFGKVVANAGKVMVNFGRRLKEWFAKFEKVVANFGKVVAKFGKDAEGTRRVTFRKIVAVRAFLRGRS